MEGPDATRPNPEPSVEQQRPESPQSPGDVGGDASDDRNFSPPPRRTTSATIASMATSNNNLEPTTTNLRRRSTARSSVRRSGVGRRPSTAGGKTRFTLAGPDDTPRLREQHENFVHPGYADLNPAYDQPASTKPVWSLAKPLPRVVRPGMVPTKSEIIESRMNAELPGEHSQSMGVDVDPNDLEKGRVQASPNPAKIAAQLKDARAQRENNFLNNTLQRAGSTSRIASSRISNVASQTSSARQRRRASTWAQPPEVMTPTYEVEGEDEMDEESDGAMSPSGRRRPRFKVAQEPQQPPPSAQPAQVLEPIDEGTEPFPDVDDGGSMTTLGLEEGDEEFFPEDIVPLVENIAEEEVHNHHTTWSVLRTSYREPLAELLAVIIQLTVGFTSDLAVTCANAGNPNTTDWAWGFATMMGIYISGGISGAHLNPTVTVMLWFFRGFPKRKMPEYFIAQFLGAFIAAFVAYGLYLSSIKAFLSTGGEAASIIDSFVTNQRYSYIDACTAFFNEFVGTAILTVTILALGDDQNAPPGAGMNSLIVGLVIVVLSMSFAFQTGSALNPSRDFGPRLALLCLGYGSDLFTNPYWFYGPFAATLTGSFLGATLYDAAIFTGGESPINYPWSRTRRAAHKSRVKWMGRLHLSKQQTKDGEDGEKVEP